jgi:hypothetical protein
MAYIAIKKRKSKSEFFPLGVFLILFWRYKKVCQMLMTLLYTNPLQFITLHHDKGQANGKLFEQTSIFINAPKAKWAPLHKEVQEKKRVFSVGSFFDTFLAVQKSMPNAYFKKINH